MSHVLAVTYPQAGIDGLIIGFFVGCLILIVGGTIMWWKGRSQGNSTIVARRRSSPAAARRLEVGAPLVWPPTPAVERESSGPFTEAIALNNRGFILLRDGQPEKGYELLKASARAGLPNAQATITWDLLLKGEAQAAYDFFASTWPKCSQYASITAGGDNVLASSATAQATGNAASNGALVCMAAGRPDEESVALLEEAVQLGSLEAQMYASLLADDPASSRREWLRLSASERADLMSDFMDAYASAAPGSWAESWFSRCCQVYGAGPST